MQVLYYVITHMTFFEDKLHLLSLNTMDSTLIPFCENTIIPKALNEANIPFTPTSYNLPVNSFALLPNYKEVPAGVTVLDQCLAEQKYVRDSMLRSVIYAQVRNFYKFIQIPGHDCLNAVLSKTCATSLHASGQCLALSAFLFRTYLFRGHVIT